MTNHPSAAPGVAVDITEADIDRALNVSIPGGSTAEAWFLPHEHAKGNANVRDVVRRMLASRPAVPSAAGDWAIDTSTGTDILVYKNCSVIQDEQAHEVLNALRTALLAGPAGGRETIPVELSRAVEGPRRTPQPVGWIDGELLRDLQGPEFEHCVEGVFITKHQTEPGDAAIYAHPPVPVRAPQEVTEEELHEFKVRLTEYGMAIRNGEGWRARTLADVLVSMLQSCAATQPSAAPAGPTDQDLWELRAQAKADPRCADQHWFILFARAAIAASKPVPWMTGGVAAEGKFRGLIEDYVMYRQNRVNGPEPELDRIKRDLDAAIRALFATPPPGEVQVDAAREMPSMYVCPAGCGCEWRANLNGTMSLYDEHQKSCGVCETLPLHKLIPAPSAPGNIQHHLYVAQRHDGMWLVCVGSQYDTKPEAQAACKSWIRHYAAIASHQAGVSVSGGA